MNANRLNLGCLCGLLTALAPTDLSAQAGWQWIPSTPATCSVCPSAVNPVVDTQRDCIVVRDGLMLHEYNVASAQWTTTDLATASGAQFAPWSCFGSAGWSGFASTYDPVAGGLLVLHSFSTGGSPCNPPFASGLNSWVYNGASVAGVGQSALLDVRASIVWHDAQSDTINLLAGPGIMRRNRAGAWSSSSFLVTPNVSLDSWYWDPIRRRLVAMSLDGASPVVWELELDTLLWNERYVVPASFVPRTGYSVALDQSTGVAVVYGGWNSSGFRSDTWHYDGQAFWQPSLGAAPASRRGSRMAYHAPSQSIIMWGGTNGSPMLDTWRYRPGTQSVGVSSYGAGCSGSVGQSVLGAAVGSLPFAGQQFVANVSNVPWFYPVFMILGFSDSSWSGVGLPVDLSTIGMPGCNLRLSVDAILPTTSLFGVAAWTIQLPPGYGGNQFFIQAVVFDPPANSMGLTLSNACRATVGY